MTDEMKYAPAGEAEARAEAARLFAARSANAKAELARIRSVGQLTVGRLMEQLATMPADAVVEVEGCDCWGEAFEAEYNNADGGVGTVAISRMPPNWRDDDD